MKMALTIAGSDSGGGAGIQADLKTFAALGVFGTSAITALTAQNTLRVEGVHAIPPEFIARQIDAVVKDIGADATKTGMLSNRRIIETVAAKIKAHGLRPLVVDPVMMAKSGDALLEPEARDALVSCLLPLATVVTPNLPEAEILCGFDVTDREGMRRAARAIHAWGRAAPWSKADISGTPASALTFFTMGSVSKSCRRRGSIPGTPTGPDARLLQQSRPGLHSATRCWTPFAPPSAT